MIANDPARALFSVRRRQEVQMGNTPQDRARVAGRQEHEVRYEAEKTGSSKSEVKDAVQEVGNSRRKVEEKLDD